MAQGGRFEEPRGHGVATYRARKQAGGDHRRSLVLWVVSKQSVAELSLCTRCRVTAVSPFLFYFGPVQLPQKQSFGRLARAENRVLFLTASCKDASFLSNAQSLLQGSGIDAPLNDVVGRAQASALARSLASIQMDLIASSTLSRAVETADIVASQLLIVQFSMGNYTLVM